MYNRRKIYVRCYAGPDVSEEEFEEQLQRLETKMAESGFRIDDMAFRLLSEEDYNAINTFNDGFEIFDVTRAKGSTQFTYDLLKSLYVYFLKRSEI